MRLALGAGPLRVVHLVVLAMWVAIAMGITVGAAGGIAASRIQPTCRKLEFTASD